VHGYDKIIFENVYSGIDWVVYTKDDFMEYDFIIHPGADPSLIKLSIQDADGYAITQEGELQIKTALGELTEKKPVTYDEQGNVIASCFEKYTDGSIGFAVKPIEGQTLRIDPEITWATYYGGAGDDYGNSCAIDGAGNVYLAGTTTSNAGIASGGFQNSSGGSFDAFIVKFNSAGGRLWSTFYGGYSDDYGTSCAVDSIGNVYLAGYTYSAGGIAAGGFQNTPGGILDAFLAKFSANGSRLWGTYYGGSAEDEGTSCCVDRSGNVYLAGYTGSTTGIASGGFQNTFGGGYYDAFLAKFNATGNRLWATYYGGASDDLANSCAVDGTGNVFLVGCTNSAAGIALNGMDNTLSPTGFYDAFLVKFNSAGTRQWGTYYGGAGDDVATSCVIDISGNLVVAGYSSSPNGIAPSGFKGGYYDAFISKFSTTGAAIWVSYYGGTGIDYGNACATDVGGNVYLAGSTNSPTGIAYGGFQNTYAGGTDAFLARFSSAGVRIWGSYYGGAAADFGNACAVRSTDSVYLAGYTVSVSGVASGGFQNTFGGGSYDAFLAKTNSRCAPAVSITVSPGTSICQGTKATFAATTVSGGTSPAYQWMKDGVKVGTNSATYVDSLLKTNDSVKLVLTSNAACAVINTATSNSLNFTVIGVVAPSVTITDSLPTNAGVTPICAGLKVKFKATATNGGTAPVYQWRKDGTNVGTNNAVYVDSTIKIGDSVKVWLTSNAACTVTTTIISNALKFAVNAVTTPTATITDSAGGSANITSLCTGTKVKFTAIVTNGGSSPVYQWRKDGANVGTNSPVYVDSLLKNNDSVKVWVTSNAACTTAPTAISAPLRFAVGNPVTPIVSITDSAGTAAGVTTICTGTKVAFKATSTNGGTLPVYQWRKDGVNVGTNSAVYVDSMLKTNDSVKVLLTSNATCALTPTVKSNPLYFKVNTIATPSAITGPVSVQAGKLYVFKVAYVAGVDYVWAVPAGDTIKAGQGTDSVVVKWGGTAGAITVKASNACGTSAAVSYTVSVTGVKDPKLPAEDAAIKVLLYPNPASDAANLRLSGFTGGVIVTVTDMAGKVVWRQEKLTNSTYTLPLSNLADGMYIVTVRDRDSIRSLKLVKAR